MQRLFLKDKENMKTLLKYEVNIKVLLKHKIYVTTKLMKLICIIRRPYEWSFMTMRKSKNLPLINKDIAK